MIIITGAAGFIGSFLAASLAAAGEQDLVLVDDFSRPDKAGNYEALPHRARVARANFPAWLDRHAAEVRWVIHLGARTDTTEQDTALFDRLNLHYSQAVWRACVQHRLPLIYASSAATYGDGSRGFDDADSLTPQLAALNPYGASKLAFDQWVLQQPTAPPRWAGLRFFNVYGPHESHKGRMASVVWHAYRQIRETGRLRLFRSHRPDYEHGEQQRDFIYVKDVVAVIQWMMAQPRLGGIFNLGTGQARTFNALAGAVFSALGAPQQIEYIDTPIDIRHSYQYFTEARMDKLRRAGFGKAFTPLEAGVADYVQGYLVGAR
ncbi:MAG: ADP-glyceromanno-heptose 6-epimerase [Bacteroidetes bacterium]|nr:MAG: ADP-glyceromanno-heptose 6-epimerase [Bacteroidota bacterium]